LRSQQYLHLYICNNLNWLLGGTKAPGTANMQKMQRKFGVFLPRTADDQQVGMLLQDFEAADRMLEAVSLPLCYSGLHEVLTNS
jgi:hypothetical protein